MTEEQESWREISGSSGYLVSNFGRVKSLNFNRTGKPGILKQTQCGSYNTVNIRGKIRLVHRLVAEAFIPNPEKKPQVNHISCDTHDNRADNLEWVTREENLIKYFQSDKFKQIAEEQRRIAHEEKQKRNASI